MKEKYSQKESTPGIPPSNKAGKFLKEPEPWEKQTWFRNVPRAVLQGGDFSTRRETQKQQLLCSTLETHN